MDKTKIVCTIGPASCDRKTLEKLAKAGMNVARLNGSHNTLDWHEKSIKLIRSVDKNIPILLDLPGRKIRTAKFKHTYKLKNGKTIIFTSVKGYKSSDKVAVNYSGLHRDLKRGNIILADDGTLKFRVVEVKGTNVFCRILTDGELKGGKGLNVPYVKVNTPLITEDDKRLIKFAIKNKVDWVGLSFVENGEHVRKVKKLLGNSGIGVIAKTENKFGIDNIESILKESDGILIDRGDLGAETSIANIGVIQKKAIIAANSSGRPVIVATEMLHSMIEKRQPTKAEVTDITNSIMDGASAIMLSGETAVGIDPVNTVKVMRSVADEAEKYFSRSAVIDSSMTQKTIPSAIGKSIYEISKEMPIDKVVCITLSGYAARMISRYKLDQMILAVTDKIEKARKFNLLWGVTGICLGINFVSKDYSHIIESAKQLWKEGFLKKDDLVVFTAVILPYRNAKMNYLQIHKMSDLIALFKWGN
ncbi:MAG: pyruvate kinase [Candidatus Saganbacteria bacterium]|nr:pyruvate kinase [Candidatus Saganbacteria bacterium]